MPMWCVAPLEMNEGNSLGGARVQSAYRLQWRKGPTRDLLLLTLKEMEVNKEKRECLKKCQRLYTARTDMLKKLKLNEFIVGCSLNGNRLYERNPVGKYI